MSGFVFVSGTFMELPGDIPAVSAEGHAVVDSTACVAVLAGGLPEIRRAAAVVVDGDCPGELPPGVCGIQLITCGRGCRNTVSISSDCGDRLTLALNRPIRTLTGVCEPMELTVERHGRTDFECMAGFAAAIIINTEPE